jgi:RHS repeat-associated protein
MRYNPWGEVRYNWGSTPTDYTYTGQYSNVPEFGLYYYNARWYDPQLGRFAQADTIVPLASQGVQAWDRYAGMNNNPVRYNDPSGHDVGCAGESAEKCRQKNRKYQSVSKSQASSELDFMPIDGRGYAGCVTVGPQTSCTTTLVIELNSEQTRTFVEFINDLDDLHPDPASDIANYIVQEASVSTIEKVTEYLGGKIPGLGMFVDAINQMKEWEADFSRDQIDSFSDDVSNMAAGNPYGVVVVAQTGYFDTSKNPISSVYISAHTYPSHGGVSRIYDGRYAASILNYFFSYP